MASVMPTPSDVCSLAQHRPLLSHANHVGSRLRQVTCATRVVGRSLLRALTKLSVTVATSSHRIIRGLISPDWPRFSKSLVLSRLMPLSTNLVPIVSTALLISGLSNWMSVVLIPLTLPCRYLSHGRQCPTLHIPPSESAVEEPARARRKANKKASSNALQGLDQAPAKAVAGSLQKHF